MASIVKFSKVLNKMMCLRNYEVCARRWRSELIVSSSSIKGFVEWVSPDEVSGWAVNLQDSGNPLTLKLLINGVVLAETSANRSRPDLDVLSLSSTDYGFHFFLKERSIMEICNLQIKTGDIPIEILDSAPCLEGMVETRSWENISGWAWRVGCLDIVVEVDILVAGKFIQTVSANEFRQDLVASGVGKGAHAFSFSLCGIIAPNALQVEDIKVVFRETHEPLTVLPLANFAAVTANSYENGMLYKQKSEVYNVEPWKASSTNISDVDGVATTNLSNTSSIAGGLSYERGIVRGWIYNKLKVEPEWIDIILDGVTVWSGEARRLENMLVDGEYVRRPAGFRVQLPLPSGWTSTRTVEVRNSLGDNLPGSPLEIPYGDQFLGAIESISHPVGTIKIVGWCINTTLPSNQVALSVFYDDQLVLTGETNKRRLDLSSSGFDAPMAGFELILVDEKLRLRDLNRVTVRPCWSNVPLTITANAIESSKELESVRKQIKITNSTDEIEGTIDEVSSRFISGWARNKAYPESIVILDCFIDGVLYATTTARRFRPDLQKHFGDHGYHQYLFELTPTLSFQSPGRMEVVPRIGVNKIKQKIQVLKQGLPKSKIVRTGITNYMSNSRLVQSTGSSVNLKIALIIINKDGEDLLSSFLSTFYELNTYKPFEIIIVDHNSTDQSEKICRKWMKKLNLRWFQRSGNFSFSHSNNFAVAQTDAELILFVNNDISFSQDVLGWIMHYMSNLEIGCLGIKLHDDSQLPRDDLQIATQHLGVHFDASYRNFAIEPFESRYTSTWRKVANVPMEVPAVTGAFMVCRRREFLDIGGFNERYFYGHEDVDLCLMYHLRAQKVVCANDLSALHLRGFSRDRMDQKFNQARVRNRSILDERFGHWMRRKLAEHRFDRPGFWSSVVPRIAFAVTEATEITMAGDFFTALELASQLSALFPCECAFVEHVTGNQYDLAGFDVVIAMRDDFDPRQIKDASSHLITIAWVRNWFDRFSEREAASYFDCVWASSPKACIFLEHALGKPVSLVPIATNWHRFRAGKIDPQMKSDYVFTGSYWGLNREIVQMLDPAALPFDFAIYGTGWEQVPHLAPYSRGSLPYKRMPDVYANTRVVIDDANHVTKAWGAVNSRVYDALTVGALVLTNGRSGSEEMFDGKLPTYDTPQELEGLLWHYLTDEKARLAKVAELQIVVQKRHTYQHRARTTWSIIGKASRDQLRIAIKIGAPNWKVREEWGDYHFALSMKHNFDLLGHTARIDCLDTWYRPSAIGDDVVIVLRGLTPYVPRAHQINLMWNISHPDKVSIAEYHEYDHVFIASLKHTELLSLQLGTKVSALLQCTDPRYFHPDAASMEPTPNVLFVGNSRNTFRRIVRHALEANLPLEVYGNRWEGFLTENVLKAEYIPNKELAAFYKSARVLLNDHWDNMAVSGFLSNRLFDAAACGARILTDKVDGIAEVFGDLVKQYGDVAELGVMANQLMNETHAESSARQTLAKKIIKNHSFGARIECIMKVVSQISTEKSSLENLTSNNTFLEGG